MDQILHQLTGMAPWIFSILLALTVHEASHALVADRLGDDTARLAGRLTLNPIAHIDPLGAVAFIVAHIGWAKPVPVNPYRFRNPRGGMMRVSLAGPLSNLALAAVMALAVRAIPYLAPDGLSGTTERAFVFLFLVAQTGVWINVALALFNLIPIPPLDGSKVLEALLPAEAAMKYAQVARYGPLLLLLLIFSGAFRYTLAPMIDATARLLSGL